MYPVHLYHTVNILIGIGSFRPNGILPFFQDVRSAFQIIDEVIAVHTAHDMAVPVARMEPIFTVKA